MARLQKQLEQLDADLAAAGTYQVQLAALGEAIAACDAELAVCEEQWLELSEELENR